MEITKRLDVRKRGGEKVPGDRERGTWRDLKASVKGNLGGSMSSRKAVQARSYFRRKKSL